jgi:ribosomal protein S18 acetylase RimI-like enzyme
MEIKFIRATIDDVGELIDLQNQCFYQDYLKYGQCSGYNHTKESMTDLILNRIVYKIVYNNQLVGDIIVKDNHDNTYSLSCICVKPDFENRGIGQHAIKFMESQFPAAVVWNLKTPADKKKNYYFYKKLGYSVVEEHMEGPVKIATFQKKMFLYR